MLELFSRDGVGTMVNADTYDSIRRATIDDIGGILELIRPLEESGALVRGDRARSSRPRSRISTSSIVTAR